MIVRFTCKCGRKLKTSDPDNFGTDAKCPKCGEFLKVPFPRSGSRIWGLIGWAVAISVGMKFLFWVISPRRETRLPPLQNTEFTHRPSTSTSTYTPPPTPSPPLALSPASSPPGPHASAVSASRPTAAEKQPSHGERAMEDLQRYFEDGQVPLEIFNKEIEAAGFGTLTSPPRLAADNLFKHSRMMIIRFRDASKKLRAALVKQEETWPPKSIRDLSPELQKRAYRCVFSERLSMLANFDDIVTCGEHIVDLLDEARGHWEYNQAGQMVGGVRFVL